MDRRTALPGAVALLGEVALVAGVALAVVSDGVHERRAHARGSSAEPCATASRTDRGP